MTTQMLKYVNSIIDDNYAMEVLYYSIRKTIIDNGFTLNGVTSIRISNKFVKESAVININHYFSKPVEAFALLLSIKALIMYKELICRCDSDSLLFKMHPSWKDGWIEYVTYIIDFMKNDDFRDIYYILGCAYAGKISEEDKEYFKKSTVVPEYKNLHNYYRDIAKKESGVVSEVICNNAFVCDDSLTEYETNEDIAYIGNTAFAYCSNLTSITLKRDNIIFGKFPIIECNNLKKIMVPFGSEYYYKKVLPYYKEIIFPKKNNKSIAKT